jgi:hypothetical protein
LAVFVFFTQFAMEDKEIKKEHFVLYRERLGVWRV